MFSGQVGREGLVLFSGVEMEKTEPQRSDCCDLPKAFCAEVPGLFLLLFQCEQVPPVLH